MTKIVVAGSTGDLGARIVNALAARGASVVALTRGKSPPHGATVARVDMNSIDDIARACDGASCVVSALSGLREDIVDGQLRVLDAAVKAGVPRFIPSDFACDFTKTRPGRNRNLDWRRELNERAESRAIALTSILNGAFAELLTGEAPFILYPIHRVLCWGNPDQKLDFTTKDNVAAYTAAAALDDKTPRILRISGSEVSARDLADAASDVLGKRFGILRPGSTETLSVLIRVTQFVRPAPNDTYPPWQGMQYMRDMYEGAAKLEPLDNDRYDVSWTNVREVIAGRGDARPGRHMRVTE